MPVISPNTEDGWIHLDFMKFTILIWLTPKGFVGAKVFHTWEQPYF